MTTNTLAIEKVSCLREQHWVLKNISCYVNRGELLLITGKNGSGKSTLLRFIAGLATPFTGNISYQGGLHYLGHQNGLKLGLTVAENLMMAALCSHHCYQNNKETNSLADLVKQALDIYQLTPYQQKLASELSAGQKRKVALCKLHLTAKSLWVLDEPLTALDTDSQTIFLQQLITHLNQGGMACISSHQELPLYVPGLISLHLERLC